MKIQNITLEKLILNLESGSREKGGSIESGIISIGGTHISNVGGFKWNKKEFISKKFFDKLKSGVVKNNDILIVKDGATTGKVSYVDTNFPFKDAAINEHVFRLEINPTLANPKYVFYFLFSSDGQREILKDFRGATVGGISRNFVNLVNIPLPNIQTQNKIVSILDKASALISKRESSIKLLDELLRATFLDMFGNLINNPQFNNIDTLQNNIAEGDNINYGVVQPGEEYPNGIPIIRVGDFEDSYINLSSLKRIDPEIHKKHKNSILKGGEILIACVGATIGKIALVEESCKGFNIVRATARVNCGKKIKNTYLLNLLLTDFYQQQLKSLARTVAQPTLNIKQIAELQIPIPLIENQIIFDEFYHNLILNKKRIKGSLKDLNTLSASLFQRAFNGDLNFNIDAEIDSLLNEIDLQKKENDLSKIVGDEVYLQRLIDKLNTQEFKEKDLYNKAKHCVFQLLKEGNKVTQDYKEKDKNEKNKKMQLVLK